MDPYAVLGVARDAPTDEIRQAYVALARRTHPDVRGDDPAAAEQMRRINLAWEMLSDADSRAAIDRRLSRPPQPKAPQSASPAGERAAPPTDDDIYAGHYDRDDDLDDRPITEGNLPGWMRLGAPAAFVVGIFAVIFGVMAGGFVLLRLGLLLLGLSVLLFMLSPFVVLIRSRGGPLR
ncbi:MAG: J domain-containing protein [Acidimicrobiaceae bacterium]|nr:J domain-containing protein [Acidimicrobiaceae bacterium]MDE0492303.1 J domain-containing protein [Acidimicrobiaceae bacterium]MXY11978.1 J domain-containing protein [Acidimicrobiaceae bacterium]MXZ65186.1 J domain-containing protein [Acidimicrobiaceae bacterium]MYE57230.1 J domain-containing protein [Acidimicrobiaceae bacterium]